MGRSNVLPRLERKLRATPESQEHSITRNDNYIGRREIPRLSVVRQHMRQHPRVHQEMTDRRVNSVVNSYESTPHPKVGWLSPACSGGVSLVRSALFR